MKKFIVTILFIISNQFINSQIDYAFSYPGIIPATELENSNPNSSQLDPNKIHLVVLGDGYHVYDITGEEPNIEYEVTLVSLAGVQTPLINRFFNKELIDGYLGQIADEYQQVELPQSAQGDAEDVLDYIFGYEGEGVRPGSGSGDYTGFTPFKEYKHFFNTYRVLYNSENSPPNLGNGIGHPYVDDSQLNMDCELTGNQTTPSSSHQSYWGTEFDFCDAHAALTCDYNKIDEFIDEYFPNVPVFVLVIANTGVAANNGKNYGGAANINKRVAVISSRYQIGPGSSNFNFEDRGALHEFAHIFGELLDEYWFDFNSSLSCFETLTLPGQTEQEALDAYHDAPNRADNSSAFNDASHKWNHWNRLDLELNYNEMYLSGPEIDIHAHLPLTDPCTYCDPVEDGNTVSGELIDCWVESLPQSYNKPSHLGNCVMENVVDERPFCAVCREALVMRIYEEVDPINSFIPDNIGGEEFNLSSSQNFELNLTIPVRSDLGSGNDYKSMEVTWEIFEASDLQTAIFTNEMEAGPTSVNLATGEFFYSLTENSVCDLFDEWDEGTYQIKATIHDKAGLTDDLIDNTRWVRHPNADHTWEVVWNVYYSGIPEVDLYSMDQPDDSGVEPYVSSDVLWISSDIWLCNDDDQDCDFEDEGPIIYSPGAQVQVNVRLRNRGCTMYDDSEDAGTVDLYWAKAGTGLEWPESWDGETELAPGGPIAGDEIALDLNIGEDVDINGDGIVVSAMWPLIDPSVYAGIISDEEDITHFCFLSVINVPDLDPYTMQEDPGELYPLFANVKESNNVVWRNLTILDDLGGGIIGSNTSTDVIRGGAVIVSNNDSLARNYKLRFEVPSSESGKPITEEAEVRIILSDSLWSKWIDGGQQSSSVSVYDSTLHQIKLNDTLCTISGMSLDSNSHLGMYVSVNFLTQERTSKQLFTLHVTQILDDSTQKVIGGETYVIKPDPNRSHFDADAGSDQDIIIGEVFTQKANTISDSALYNWYDSNGNRIFTGVSLSDTATTTSSETYKLEVIAKSDGYKDYDEVTITSTLGQITSVAPNPISTGTLATGYKVSSSATSPKIRIVNVNTSAYTEHTITTGTGTLNVDISSYATGSHTVLLICNSSTVDDELLVVQ